MGRGKIKNGLVPTHVLNVDPIAHLEQPTTRAVPRGAAFRIVRIAGRRPLLVCVRTFVERAALLFSSKSYYDVSSFTGAHPEQCA